MYRDTRQASLKGILIVLCVFAGAVYGIIYLLNVTEEGERELDQKLFLPYFETIFRQDYQKAWADFTTERYRKKNSLDQFTRHYQAVLAEYGRISDVEVLMTQGTKELASGRSYDRVKLKIHFNDRFVIVWYEVVPDAGRGFRIDGSSLSTQIIPHIGPW